MRETQKLCNSKGSLKDDQRPSACASGGRISERERGTEGGGVIKCLTLLTSLHIFQCIQREVQEICTNIDTVQ